MKTLKYLIAVGMLAVHVEAASPVISANSQLPTTCGSSGQILQANGNCTSTWVANGGGGGGSYINNAGTLQSGAQFFVSSGTVNTSLMVGKASGALNIGAGPFGAFLTPPIFEATAGGEVVGTITSVGDFLFGDPTGIFSGNYLFLNQAANSFTFQQGVSATLVLKTGNVGIGNSSPSGLLEVSSAGSSYLLINPAGQRYNIGDLNLAGNGSRLLINDGTQEVYLQGNTRIDLQARTGTFGDSNAVGNSTVFTVDDPNTRFTFIGGNVGIGTATPGSQLHTTGSVRFANFGAGAATFDASGNISSVSDERLKNIQGGFKTSVERLKLVEPILYKWKKESGMETEHVYAGFSAQNIQKAIPEASGQNGKGYLSIQDRALLAVVINAIKDLDARISKLEVAK